MLYICVCVHVCRQIMYIVCMDGCRETCMHESGCIQIYMHAVSCLSTILNTYMQVWAHTYLHAYIHTYKHTFLTMSFKQRTHK